MAFLASENLEHWRILVKKKDFIFFLKDAYLLLFQSAFQNRRRRRRFSKDLFCHPCHEFSFGFGACSKGINVLILLRSRVTQTQKPFFLSLCLSICLSTWGKLKKVAKKRFGRAGNHGAAGEKRDFREMKKLTQV